MELQSDSNTPGLLLLSQEHHEGLLFTDHVQLGIKTVSLDRVRNYVRWYWKNHIRPHLYQEEEILLPYLTVKPEVVARVKKDHLMICDLVLELDAEGDASVFQALCRLLRNHIQFEEEYVLAWAGRELDAVKLSNIQKALQERETVKTVWHDCFWVQNKPTAIAYGG